MVEKLQQADRFPSLTFDLVSGGTLRGGAVLSRSLVTLL